MDTKTIVPIGRLEATGEGYFVQVDPAYRQALQGMEGYTHLQILWWFSRLDTPACRRTTTCGRPYRTGPEKMGIFATRSPVRPNPIALTTARIVRMDGAAGRIQVDFCDAMDGSPLVDLKPYIPAEDRVENPGVPAWCAHWPRSLEEAGDFDWENEIRGE